MTKRVAGSRTKAAAGDFETRGSATGRADLRLWLRLMAVHKLTVNALRRRLRAESGTSLARFDLMSQLVNATDGLRMGVLTERLMVTTGNITGLVDELEAAGLVSRKTDPDNRRAIIVRLTAKGRRHFVAAAKRHEAWIAAFFAEVSVADKARLYDLAGALKASVAIAVGARPTR